MTAIVSRNATSTSPIVPANESNNLSQYSPAPVQNTSPTKKQMMHTTPASIYSGVVVKNNVPGHFIHEENMITMVVVVLVVVLIIIIIAIIINYY